MKQKLLNKFWLRVGMIVAVMTTALAGTAWAEEEVYKTALFGSSYNSQSISSYTAAWSATNAGFTVNLANFNNNGNSWNYVKCGRKNNASVATIITADAIDKAITKVVVTIDAITASSVNSIKLYTSSDNSNWTEAGSFSKATGAQTVTLSSPAANLYYKAEFDCASGSSNGLVTVSKVEYYYSTGGALTVATPVISGDESFLTSTEVSISCGTADATIQYSTNNGTTWTNYSAPFTLTETTTVQAKATKSGMTDSDVASKTFTKATVMTVAEAKAAIDAGTGTTNVYVAGKISQIDSYNSQYNSITYWISTDGTTTDQFEVYSGKGLNNTNFTAVTDIELGADVIVFGNIKKFNDIYEFDKNNYLVSYTAPVVAVEAPTFTPVAGTYAEAQSVTISTTTSGATIYYTTDGTEPVAGSNIYNTGSVVSVSETTTLKAIAVKGTDQSTVATATYFICSAENPYTVTEALAFPEYPANGVYVHGIVSTAPTQAPTSSGQLTYYISVDGEATNQLEVYKGKGLEQAAFTAQDDIKVGDIVTIYGNVKIYNNAKEFDTNNYLVSFERPAAPVVPVINAEATLSLAYDATSGEIAYTVENPVEGTSLTATSSETWLTIGTITGTEVPFTCSANEGGEDRTATVTLTYGSVTKTVTVTQGHFVVDYAELPFSYNSGKSSIANTTGLTQEGLGSDYNSDPKLKFDNTGDYLILKINERPGTLTFDIKGNSFSGGTFKVQTSVDGTTYTDLETYTEINNTYTQSEVFNNLDANIRYIKWVYTTKYLGNVALGNIKLAKYGEAQTYTLSWTAGEHTELFVFDEEDDSEPLTSGVSVAEGTTIYVSVGADEGYEISALTVKDANNSTITLSEVGENYYSFEMPASNVTITSSATQSSVTPVTGDKYVKVTSTDDLTDGQYLIVYEEGSVAFNGGLETLDAVGNTIEVTISNNEIAATSATTAAEFTIQETEDGYSIESASGLYIGQTSDANGLKADASTVYANAITFSDKNANIVSGGAYLRYNANSGQTRFRYFKSSTYTNQKAIQLYKFVEATPEPYAPETITLNASGYATFASTSAVDFTNAETNGYSAWAITGVNGSEITFSQITGTVAAGTGVLLKGTASAQVTIEYTTSGATLSDNKLEGVVAPKAIEAGQYYGLSGAKFVKVNTGTVPAGKALLPANVVEGTGDGDGVKTLTFNFDEDATAIETLSNSPLKGENIYNLAGQRLSKMQKGINIVNGRKVLY